MSTRLIIKDRGEGKSTELIHTSEVTGYPIVVPSLKMKLYLEEKARESNCIIPEPVTLNEIKAGYLRGHKIDNVLIDEAYDIIGDALDEYFGYHVVAATLTDKLKYR